MADLAEEDIARLRSRHAMQAQAIAQATERRRSQEMERIRATLARIDEDKVGYCVRCGEEIAAKRLELADNCDMHRLRV